jgi:hypothetical protein
VYLSGPMMAGLPDLNFQHRTRAEAEAASTEARRVVDRWNEELAAGRDMWWSPTIGAALATGTLSGLPHKPQHRSAHDRSAPACVGRELRSWAAVIAVSGISAKATIRRTSGGHVGLPPDCRSRAAQEQATRWATSRSASRRDLL